MPDVGERVLTVDGMGVVVESNILENKIKVRLVLEEQDGDKPEKLSPDFSYYTKQQIRRLGKKNEESFEDDDEIDASLLQEIKSLLQD